LAEDFLDAYEVVDEEMRNTKLLPAIKKLRRMAFQTGGNYDVTNALLGGGIYIAHRILSKDSSFASALMEMMDRNLITYFEHPASNCLNEFCYAFVYNHCQQAIMAIESQSSKDEELLKWLHDWKKVEWRVILRPIFTQKYGMVPLS
jgi:hypothetical protein